LSRHHDHRHITLVGLLWTSVQPDVDFYLPINNDKKRQTAAPPAGFEPTIPVAVDPRLRPCGHWDLHCLRIHAVKNLLYVSNMLQKDKGLFLSEV